MALTHDAEFVCEQVGRSHESGWESGIVSGLVEPRHVGSTQTREQVLESLGLAANVEAASKIHGKGDEKFLEAIRTLFKLKDEGVIKRVGISGYPLPVLLRLSRLVATTAPYRPLDVVLNYSNHCLHSDVLEGWKELFAADPRGSSGEASLKELTWRAPLLLNGSPFSMGLLTDGNPPPWHPASSALQQQHERSQLDPHFPRRLTDSHSPYLRYSRFRDPTQRRQRPTTSHFGRIESS